MFYARCYQRIDAGDQDLCILCQHRRRTWRGVDCTYTPMSKEPR